MIVLADLVERALRFARDHRPTGNIRERAELAADALLTAAIAVVTENAGNPYDLPGRLAKLLALTTKEGT